MKGRQIVLDHLGDRRAAALMVDGRLEDLLVEPPAAIPLPGAIYRARVLRPLKGQGGVIVELERNGSRGFLRQAKGLREGAALLVQVTGFAEAGKAAPVTARLLFKSRYAIATPDAPGLNLSRSIKDEETRLRIRETAEAAELPARLGLILRSAAAGADEDALAADIAAAAGLARTILDDAGGTDPELLLEGPDPEELAWRDWAVTGSETVLSADGSFEEMELGQVIDGLLSPEEPIAGGGRIFVEPTRALVAVDVDTGGDTSPAAGLKANIAAARALPRALRLRGLGGQVTVDFAPIPKKDRRMLEQALRAAFRADPVETALVGWSPLGHFELLRKRERLPLKDCLP